MRASLSPIAQLVGPLVPLNLHGTCSLSNDHLIDISTIEQRSHGQELQGYGSSTDVTKRKPCKHVNGYGP